jgi:hypothetical protein
MPQLLHRKNKRRGIMGYYVHINVCFACHKNDGVAELAAKHRRALLEPNKAGVYEACMFLDSLAKRQGYNPGPKGGLSTWGMIGNYTDGKRFVECLIPFWKELLSNIIDDGPCGFEHILVFVEPEDSAATAYEIFWANQWTKNELKIVKHECPFRWNQM